jgi:hypothetical protein
VSVLYFAYDEKMFSPILSKIAPNAINLGVAKLAGFKLYFHNKSKQDSSGKGNIVPHADEQAAVYGVLYQISLSDKAALEKELKVGLANQEIIVDVTSMHSLHQTQKAITFVACRDNVHQDLVPYAWYKAMVIQGALSHNLPQDYINWLGKCPCVEDPNSIRNLNRRRELHSHYF